MKSKKVLLVVACEGYQPVEYNEPKKILANAGFTIITASNKPNIAIATDNSTTMVDLLLDTIQIDKYAGIFFIGGSGALEHLDNETSYQLLQKADQMNMPLGAICISTRILAKAGVLEGKRATGWNGDDLLPDLYEKQNVTYLPKEEVVVDNSTITATGPSAAKEFGNLIVTLLRRKPEL